MFAIPDTSLFFSNHRNYTKLATDLERRKITETPHRSFNFDGSEPSLDSRLLVSGLLSEIIS
jgi:hypothetical protein